MVGGINWAVNCNWNRDDHEWNLNAYPVTNPNEWNMGNQVISGDSLLSFPALRLGSFIKQTFSPSANHFANRFNLGANGGVLIGGDEF